MKNRSLQMIIHLKKKTQSKRALQSVHYTLSFVFASFVFLPYTCFNEPWTFFIFKSMRLIKNHDIIFWPFLAPRIWQLSLFFINFPLENKRVKFTGTFKMHLQARHGFLEGMAWVYLALWVADCHWPAILCAVWHKIGGVWKRSPKLVLNIV